jgi:hypothetical protein
MVIKFEYESANLSNPANERQLEASRRVHSDLIILDGLKRASSAGEGD